MQASFLTTIQKEKLFNAADKVLLTVSGGVDSVVMCELFYKAGFKFAIAHCNFQLRGKESEGDELFVASIAKKYKVPFYCKCFDTSAYSHKKGISIQMAARELRYNWFEEIRKKENFQQIATAHHADDCIETFFINLIRGTGISGLHGILPKQGNIIRPLLFATKDDIESFAKKNKLNYREDSSNASDKYMRNKLRHKVIPVLKELNPAFGNTLGENIQRLRDIEQIYKKDIESKRANLVKKEKENFHIFISELKKLPAFSAYLYEFLRPFSFNAETVDAIIKSLGGESGKRFFSETHRLIKDRNVLIIQKKTENRRQKAKDRIQIKKNQPKLTIDDLQLKFKTSLNPKSLILNPKSSLATIDYDKLKFPLALRKWQQGDVFYPLGMKGKKKLSDFFIDKKLSINEKENIWLLTSNNNIVWVIGMRMDDRYKITSGTKKIYFAELV